MERGAGDGDDHPWEAGPGAEVVGPRVPRPQGRDRPEAVQDVALAQPAGIGGRDETIRERALAEEPLEALESGGCLLGDLDP